MATLVHPCNPSSSFLFMLMRGDTAAHGFRRVSYGRYTIVGGLHSLFSEVCNFNGVLPNESPTTPHCLTAADLAQIPTCLSLERWRDHLRHELRGLGHGRASHYP